MKLIICDSFEAMSVTAAKAFAEAFRKKPDGHIGLTTGATPVGFYAELVKMYREEKLSFAQAHFYNLEEMTGLPASNPHSCYSYLREHLTDHVDLPSGNLILPNGIAEDAEAECARYGALLDGLPSGRLDIQVLGIGANGHIGCNEPEEKLYAECHKAKLREGTIAASVPEFGSIEKVPPYTTALGMRHILQASKILMLANGSRKAHAVKGMLSGRISTDCPASFLQCHPDVTVILDQEAAAEL